MRYAIYFAPHPSSLLHELGSRWLGRDAYTGAALPRPAGSGFEDIVAEPRRYGFHATLKPPFALTHDRRGAELERALEVTAAAVDEFDVKLALEQIDGFLALVSASPSPALHQLADLCVRDFDGFRAPAEEDEIARRRKAGLTPRQDAQLLRWGYPYVFEDFRFHMTLTRRLSAGEAEEIVPVATEFFVPVMERTQPIDGLTLFREPKPSEPFAAGRQFRFRPATAKAAQ